MKTFVEGWQSDGGYHLAFRETICESCGVVTYIDPIGWESVVVYGTPVLCPKCADVVRTTGRVP